MLLFVIYIFSIAITSDFFARRKVKLGEIAYAVFFIVVGFFLLFILIDEIQNFALIIIARTRHLFLLKVIQAPFKFIWMPCNILIISIISIISVIIIGMSIFILENFYKFKIIISNTNNDEKKYLMNEKTFLFIKNKKKLFLVNCRCQN